MGKTLRRNAAGDCDEVLAPLHPAISTSAFVLTLIALLVGGVGAAFAEESVPVNATEKRYASGWTCDPGYQENEGACEVVQIPAKAYDSTTSLGPGWECSRGYRRSEGVCAVVTIPDNAYLDSKRGDSWSCHRGFRESDDLCVVN